MEADTAKQENPSIPLSMSKPKYKVLDVESIIKGECSSIGDTNVAIDGVVAKVHVNQFNFDDFFANKSKYLQSKEGSARGKKRKLQKTKQEDSSSQETNKSGFENQIKKRGRPKKIQRINFHESETSDESDIEIPQVREVKKRGRPKKLKQINLDVSSETSDEFEREGKKKGRPTKLNTSAKIVKAKVEPEPNQLNRLSVKPSGENLGRFNGRKSSDRVLASTSRIIKPNSRLQDFVVSSNVRYYAQSPTNKAVKEITATPKEKAPKKIIKSTINDPLKITKSFINDPLKITKSIINDPLKTTNNDSGDDDVVRSFLPIFDDSPQFYESDTAEHLNKPNKQFKEKENQVNNVQPKISKNDLPKPKSFKSDESDYSPPKLRSRNDSNSKSTTIKSPEIIVKNNINTIHQKKTIQSPAVKICTNANIKIQPKTQNIVGTKVKPTPKPKAKMNGSNSTMKQHKMNVKYILVDSDDGQSRIKGPKVGYVDFNKLVRSLKLVKLPAANWKIRIVVSKQQTITEVTFTNKEVNERCIKFSRTIAGYVVTFGKSIVTLLGAPTKISSFNDVSVLLDIVHNISPNDPILEYSIISDP